MEYYYPLLDVRGACRMVDGFSLMFSLLWALMTLESLAIFFNQTEAVLIPTWFSCLPLTRPKKVDDRQRVKADQREVCHWPFFDADNESTHYRHWRFLPAVLILREAHELFGKRKANIFSLRSKHTVAPCSAVIRAAKSQNTCEDLGYFCSRVRDCFIYLFFLCGSAATQFKCENANVGAWGQSSNTSGPSHERFILWIHWSWQIFLTLFPLYIHYIHWSNKYIYPSVVLK